MSGHFSDKTISLAPSFQSNQCIQQKESCCLIKGQLFLDFIASRKAEIIINNNFILIKDTQNQFLRTEINMSLKFQLISQNNQTLKKIGFRLLKQVSNQCIQVYTFDSDLLKKIINVLRKKINQLGFHQQFKPIRKLGKGQFAAVFEVQCFETGNRFAVKGFSKINLRKISLGMQSLLNQIKIMRSFNHPNLQNLYSVYQTENSLYLVTELLKGGTLYDRLHKMQKLNKKLNIENVSQFMHGILEGLKKLSAYNIVHRDLKLDNIMLRDMNSFEPVIIDFGLATFSDEPDYIYYRCGTPGFVSPQVMNSTESTKIMPISDIYSSGAIMYQLLVSKPLFSGTAPEEVLRNNKKFQINFKQQILSVLPQSAVSLMQDMLKTNPLQRISAQQALLHPFFTKKKKNNIFQNITNKNLIPVVLCSVQSSLKTLKDQNKF